MRVCKTHIRNLSLLVIWYLLCVSFLYSISVDEFDFFDFIVCNIRKTKVNSERGLPWRPSLLFVVQPWVYDDYEIMSSSFSLFITVLIFTNSSCKTFRLNCRFCSEFANTVLQCHLHTTQTLIAFQLLIQSPKSQTQFLHSFHRPFHGFIQDYQKEKRKQSVYKYIIKNK